MTDLFAICPALAFWPGTTGWHPLCPMHAKEQEVMADAQDGPGEGWEETVLSRVFELVPANIGAIERTGSQLGP